jgi:hypothetical protein
MGRRHGDGKMKTKSDRKIDGRKMRGQGGEKIVLTTDEHGWTRIFSERLKAKTRNRE